MVTSKSDKGDKTITLQSFTSYGLVAVITSIKNWCKVLREEYGRGGNDIRMEDSASNPGWRVATTDTKTQVLPEHHNYVDGGKTRESPDKVNMMPREHLYIHVFRYKARYTMIHVVDDNKCLITYIAIQKCIYIYIHEH